MIIYLRANTKDDLMTAMPFLETFTDDEGATHIIPNTPEYDVEFMGPGQVYKSAEPVLDGEDTTEMILAEVEGTLYKITKTSSDWHSNLRLRDLSLADQIDQQYVIKPSVVQRSFA